MHSDNRSPSWSTVGGFCVTHFYLELHFLWVEEKGMDEVTQNLTSVMNSITWEQKEVEGKRCSEQIILSTSTPVLADNPLYKNPS